MRDLIPTADKPLRSRLSTDELQAKHGFTFAESRAVRALASGMSPDAIALDHGVSIHTIRTQLKRAMAKSGTHSQSALVAHVLNNA